MELKTSLTCTVNDPRASRCSTSGDPSEALCPPSASSRHSNSFIRKSKMSTFQQTDSTCWSNCVKSRVHMTKMAATAHVTSFQHHYSAVTTETTCSKWLIDCLESLILHPVITTVLSLFSYIHLHRRLHHLSSSSFWFYGGWQPTFRCIIATFCI